MSWKRPVFTIAVVFIAVGGVLFARRQEETARPVDSFTATQIEAFYEGEDPIVAITRTSTVALRSDGSYTQMSHFTDPSGGVRSWARRGVTDLASGEFVSIDPFSESVSTYPMSQQTAARESKAFRDTCNGESAGTVLGFDVIRKESIVTRPGDIVDRVVVLSWVAPKLHCFSLRSETLLYAQGKLTQRTIKAVTNIKIGDPPSWVFERPQGYVERAPSEARREAERRFPNHDCCKNGSLGAEVEDKIYDEARTRK